MTSRKRMAGFFGACLLVFVAFAADNAAAEPVGYTAFSCSEATTGAKFSDSHCKTGATGGAGFKHQAIASGSPKSITGTNANTVGNTTAAAPTILKGKIAGVKIGINCTGVSMSGTLTNVAEAEEMSANGTGVIAYTGCTVTEPAGKGCKVLFGTITTNELTATTKGEGMSMEIAPRVATTTLAEIPIEGCAGGVPPNNSYPVSGTLIVPELELSGATLTTNEALVTASGLLKFAGQAAGLETSVTLKGPSGGGLSVTTPPYTE